MQRLGVEVSMSLMKFITEEKDVPILADQKTLIAAFGLSLNEAGYLQKLLESNWVHKDEFPEVSYPARQVIYALRRKLEAKRIWIINDGRGKYSIPATDKTKIKLFLEAYSVE
jgi:hypothetical protein